MMSRLIHLAVLAGMLAAALTGRAAAPSDAASPPRPPNVVLILADDLGWTDLGCYGSDFYQTPHLDKLAADGVRFTQNYSACTVCSPTRAALLTGRYPARVRVTDWIPGRPPANPKLLVPDFNKQLPLAETTLAEVMKAAGYTTASIGKWHLGEEPYWPTQQGFDLNVAGTGAGSPTDGYFSPWNIKTLPEGKPGDYLTDRVGDEAVQFLEQAKEKPFLLYLPHFAVHTPIQGPAELVKKYESRDRSHNVHQNATYAAMLQSMDDAVGRLRAKLDELKIADRTIIIFTSDNGGHLPTTSNAPLRVGKGSCYEGGTRVPLMVYWPGVTQAGRVIETPTITVDLFPTVLEMAGLQRPTGLTLDGVSLAGLLAGEAAVPDRDLFWHYPHYQLYQQGGTVPYAAIRSGQWKLIEFLDGMPTELYDLKQDVSESKNRAEENPEIVNRLTDRLHAWQKRLDVQMPTQNPGYDPTKPEHDGKKKRRGQAE